MERGYVKLWRKVEDNEWFKNHKLFTFWMWCLIRASYKRRTIRVGFQEIELQPGEFIFGRKVAADHLGMSERNIRTCIDLLRKSKNVTIKTTNKFSIVSIVNWETYQQQENQNDQQNDQLLTNNRPASDQQLTTNKNIKNIKKDKKKEYSEEFRTFYSAYPNKKNPDGAWKAWQKRNGDLPELSVLLDAIEKQKRWRENANGQFRPEWKHPATWLNGGCWADEVEVPTSDSPFRSTYS